MMWTTLYSDVQGLGWARMHEDAWTTVTIGENVWQQANTCNDERVYMNACTDERWCTRMCNDWWPRTTTWGYATENGSGTVTISPQSMDENHQPWIILCDDWKYRIRHCNIANISSMAALHDLSHGMIEHLLGNWKVYLISWLQARSTCFHVGQVYKQ